MSLFPFLNLQIQNDEPAVILVWLNNRYTLLKPISHLSSADSIRPLYSNAPGETRTSLSRPPLHLPSLLLHTLSDRYQKSPPNTHT